MSRLIGLFLGILLVAGGFLMYSEKGDTLRRAWEIMAGKMRFISGNESGIPAPLKTASVPTAPPATSVGAGMLKEHLNAQPEITGTGTESLPVSPDPAETVETPRYRQVFWQPFRTRISARGFADHVRDITGLSMEVMEQGPSEFVVAFPYGDESERKRGLALIREKTRMVVEVNEGDG